MRTRPPSRERAGHPHAAQDPLSPVRDSVGVGVVESTRPAPPSDRAWRIDPRPVIVLGAADALTGAPDDSLYVCLPVMGVARPDDGRIAVGEPGLAHDPLP